MHQRQLQVMANNVSAGLSEQRPPTDKSAAAGARVKTELSVGAMAGRWLAVFPKTFPAIGAWPIGWDIQLPLVARHPIYFSPPMRVIRRLAAKFRR
jgi:hypothetical protein